MDPCSLKRIGPCFPTLCLTWRHSSSVRILFLDFSRTFDTLQPEGQPGEGWVGRVDTGLSHKQVPVCESLGLRVCPPNLQCWGSPGGIVLAPFLFGLYTDLQISDTTLMPTEEYLSCFTYFKLIQIHSGIGDLFTSWPGSSTTSLSGKAQHNLLRHAASWSLCKFRQNALAKQILFTWSNLVSLWETIHP